VITCSRCSTTFHGTHLERLRSRWTSRLHKGHRVYTCPKHAKPSAAPAPDPEQARSDVAADPGLGTHRDKYVAARHHTTPRLVKAVREQLGIPAPGRLRAKVDWAKHRTEAS
jgi:hypothetical protein